MTAHIALPAVEGDSTTPATLAPRIITGVLRDSLAFHGVAITDAMTMDSLVERFRYRVPQPIVAPQTGVR